MKPNHNKLISLHKAANDQTLLNLWQQNHPARYSNDEVGLETWRADVTDALGISDEKLLLAILSGQVSWDTISAAGSWADIVTLFPKGNEIREKWQGAKENKGLGAFLAWFDKTNPTTVDEILSTIGVTSPIQITNSPQPISNRHEESHNVNNIHSSHSSDDVFYKAILVELGVPVSGNNLAYFYAWRQAEGGRATFNPFNTTQKATGATNYNSVGVKNYVSEAQGIAATVKTMKNGRYEAILSALRNDSDPMITAEALIASPWGTGELAKKVISGYRSGAKPKPPAIGRT